jgi:hypothetical protein
MTMKKGFDFIDTRSLSDPIDVSSLEEKYGVRLPPVFRLLAENFVFRSIAGRVPDYLPNAEVSFDNFQEDLETALKIYQEQGEYYQERGVIPFAHSGMHAGGICVGTRNEDADKIFIYRDSISDRYRLVCENIFHFIRGLQG